MLNGLPRTQRELAEYMSELSELAYDAEWIEGLEFALWRAITGGPFKYGHLQLTNEHVQRLMQLSATCGGWILFNEVDEESFIPIEDWKQLVNSA